MLSSPVAIYFRSLIIWASKLSSLPFNDEDTDIILIVIAAKFPETIKVFLRMIRYMLIIFLIFLLENQVLTIDTSSGSFSLKKTVTENKFISVNAACSRRTLMAVVILRDPFYGILYARGYPLECSVHGDGSREIKLSFPVEKCGTKVTEKPDGGTQFDVFMYLQYEKHVQQASDETIQIQCEPQDVVVSTRVVPGKVVQENASTSSSAYLTTTSSTEPSRVAFESWMDILRGKMPTAVPITDYVNVGEEVTMLIKARYTDAVEVKVTECIASDGSNENEQLLIDSNGCTVDSLVMPDIQEKYNTKTGTKMFFSAFPAFQFPNRDHLHLQCKVLFCNYTCPLEKCFNHKWKTRHWSQSNKTSNDLQIIVEEIYVYHSVEIKAPLSDVSQRRQKSTASSFKELATKEETGHSPVRPDTLFCLNSTRMVAIIGFLLSILLVSLVVTICTCVRARELRRRLLQNQSFPYGRVHEYS